MGGQFTPFDPLRCPHYAQFASGLDRIHFDGIYWTLFFLVIGILFVSSWVYQSTMMYREKQGFCEDKFRRRVKIGLAWCTLLFLIAAVILVVEVFALLALQFCDGEDLMALYWATWTMLQLGSEIAILGVVLALWHHLSNVRLPLFALALGTPVLVVAGFGHVIQIALRMFYDRARARTRTRRDTEDVEAGGKREDSDSLCPSATPEEQEQGHNSRPRENELCLYFAMDVGDDERVRKWPCFAGLSNGKSIIRLSTYSGNFPNLP
ncbi:hypothetical protein F5Y00DRAFT_272425 [Daldinia vernicosa]|uniref:uncharacterized protein n=1 Tax=Daldinia vernicosa TaxID=114800 RepID=UPI002008E43F|nr:uncharacterized protein F5Y00DRAFT_272425 [Daldinia vernicosa]KAI0852778.1 hypothetical protein F5Y00DRAFT_272425 [Daldinia vernicosa]